MYTHRAHSVLLYTAFSEDKLYKNGVISKCWDNLEFLNQETQGIFRRVRQSIDKNDHKRASKMIKGEESGHMAQIIAQIVDNPRKLRGNRVDRLFNSIGKRG